MRVHAAKNIKGGKATEPALFLTTQTTIPILTQIMAGFSLGAMAIAASVAWSETLPFAPELTTKEISLVLLSLSALLFLFATEACIKSHAWDYFALSEQRRQFMDLLDADCYIDLCLAEQTKWHGIAVWAYRIGTMSVVAGAAFLFWPVSRATSITIGVFLPISLVVGLVTHLHENKVVRYLTVPCESSPHGADQP